MKNQCHWSTIGAKRLTSSRMVAGSGIEPLTSGLWVLRSNRLSYPTIVELANHKYNNILTCHTCSKWNKLFFVMNKINWYLLFLQACVIFTFVTFVGFWFGYFYATLGFTSFKAPPILVMKILLIVFYFLFSFILTIHHQVSRLHLFLLVIVADLLSNYFGLG